MIPNLAPLERVARHITDLEQLVSLTLRGLPRAKTWQRQFAAHLVDIESRLQVLRLTISLDRPQAEILSAASDVAGVCRLASVAIAGSRADRTTRTCLHLIVDLGAKVHAELSELT